MTSYNTLKVTITLPTTTHQSMSRREQKNDRFKTNGFCRMDVSVLREALQTVPNHSCELVEKAIAEKLANTLAEQVNVNLEKVPLNVPYMYAIFFTLVLGSVNVTSVCTFGCKNARNISKYSARV